MTNLIETIALALLLGSAFTTADGSTETGTLTEICSQPGGSGSLPPPPLQ